MFIHPNLQLWIFLGEVGKEDFGKEGGGGIEETTCLSFKYGDFVPN